MLLERQLAQARRLAALLDDLIAVDPDGAMETHPRAVRLDRAAASIVTRWVRRSDNFPVTVLGHPTTAWVDPTVLERVLTTLLENARRHGALPVAVQVRSHEGGGLLTVSDSGGGIPADLQDEIFLPFGRGASIDEAQPGLGLGLPVARLLAESDGGTLRVVPSSGGATLRLTLPAPPRPAQATIAATGGALGQRRAREQDAQPAAPDASTSGARQVSDEAAVAADRRG